MDEQDFRHALRATMTATPQPPPMADTPVLDAARRDRKRRRATWAGAASAAAVVAIAVGVAVVAPTSPGGSVGDASPTEVSRPVTSNTTNTAWPDGAAQVDRSGPEHDRAAALVAELAAVVPDGYGTPDDLVGVEDLDGVKLKRFMAQYELAPGDAKVWSYYAEIPVTSGDGVGRLNIEVHAPAPNLTGPHGCDLGPADTCNEVMVGDLRVAVFPSDQFGQVAGYRFADGTVLWLTQSTHFAYSGKPPLPRLPFSTQRLAELATNPRFHVS